MKILSSESKTTIHNTYIIEHEGRNLQYDEFVNEKKKVDDSILSDTATGEDIEDEDLLKQVGEFVDKHVSEEKQ